jgi:hypothetical protein
MRLRAALSLVVLSGLPLMAQPVLSFQSREVVASQLTPGSKAAWFAISHDPQPYRRRISMLANVNRDDDRDGSSHFAVDAVSNESVWIAVDLTSGQLAVASPRPELVQRSSERLAPGQIAKIARAGDFLSWFLVRPGAGAWSLTTEDSGIDDADLTNDGKVTLTLARMQPIGDSPAAPHELRAGDILLVVDPHSFAVVDYRLGK